jgi:hypothetical protein
MLTTLRDAKDGDQWVTRFDIRRFHWTATQKAEAR